MNGYHEYSAQNTLVLISTVLLCPHVRSLMPFQVSPMWSPWFHALICCPPSCPFCSPPAMPSPFVHRQLKLLPCFSPLCMYQLLSNSGVLGQKHWISKPLEAPGTATSQTSTRYQLPTLSVPQVFLIHFGIVTVWNKREKEWSLQPFFFLLELVI